MDNSRLDLNLLVKHKALLAERNVTKAAARLAFSQPTVNSQMARLRDVFADSLLLPAKLGMMPGTKAFDRHEPLHQALD